MPTDDSGEWSPHLFPKQRELVALCRPSRQNMVLVNGPRWASKTFGCHHVVADHAWNTDRGNICILTVTQSVGIDSGVWAHLTETFLPEWIEAGFGMEWVREPYIQNVTKKPACEVSNRWGTKTRITLESLKNEEEVEHRFKGKAYSMVWINELSKFKQHKTFSTIKQCFRMPHLQTEQHLFLADTNPDLDLGKQSWIYRFWYEFRTADLDLLKDMYPDADPAMLAPLQRALNLIEFTVDDNLSLTEEKKGQLMADFAHDPDLLAAYYYGRWVTASSDALFFKVFRPSFHCIGEIESGGNPEPEMMVPEENCSELITSLDPGGTNCAGVIIEKCFRTRDSEVIDEPVFKLLDELVVVGADFDLQDFIEQFVRKMEYWEAMLANPKKCAWRHWGDRSVFDMKVPFSDRYWHQYIYEYSGRRISIMAAERGKGSVNARIDLFRKLLWEERVFISNTNCPWTINMCRSIKRGRTVVGGIAKGDIHKHVFDAATYGLASECYEEVRRQVHMNTRRMKPSSLVSIPL